MSQESGRAHARQRVANELAARQMNPAEFSRAAGVDNDTVSDFLAGKRWPQLATRSKLATALGWTPNSIDYLVDLHEPSVLDEGEVVRPADDDVPVLGSLPPDALEGLSPADRAEVIAAAKLSALQTAREIRRRLGE